MSYFLFFFNDTATTEIYTLSLHDALPICVQAVDEPGRRGAPCGVHRNQVQPERGRLRPARSEEHTSELQSQSNIVCRLLLEKKKTHRSHRVRLERMAGATASHTRAPGVST